MKNKLSSIKKLKKKRQKRFTSIILLSSLLLSCFSPWGKKEIKAFAGPVTAVSDFGKIFSVITGMASLAGGGSVSEVVTPRESAGITNMDAALNYVKKSTSGNFTKMFSFESATQLSDFQTSLAEGYLTSNWVLSDSWLSKIWSQWTDGSSAIKIEDNANDIPAEVIQFPSGDNDNDSDDDDNEDKNVVFPTKSLPYILGSPTFLGVYSLVRKMKSDEFDKKFNKKNEMKDSDFCDYSKTYWHNHPTVFDIDKSFSLDFQHVMSSYGYNMFEDDYSVLNSPNINYCYPLIYQNQGKSFMCLASDSQNLTSYEKLYISKFTVNYQNSICGVYNESAFERGVSVEAGLEGIADFQYKSPLGLQRFGDFINYIISNRAIINSDLAKIYSSNLISCGNYENVEKFRQYIKTGDYTVEELLDCMEDGWKGMKTTHFPGIDDKGKTAKKALENDDVSKKVTTTGVGKTTDGKKHKKVGVSFDSLVRGAEKGVIRDIVGDPIKGTPVEYPSNPNPNPNKNPQTNPESDPNKNPQTNPESDPNKNPQTNPESDPNKNPQTGNEGDSGKIEDIDPDKVKTPQLLKKFPFCVPWDVVDLISAFSAEKKAPIFKMPFKLNSRQSNKINIDENIIVDFSKYEKLASICRWFFRLMFIAGLVILTRYIVKG